MFLAYNMFSKDIKFYNLGKRHRASQPFFILAPQFKSHIIY